MFFECESKCCSLCGTRHDTRVAQCKLSFRDIVIKKREDENASTTIKTFPLASVTQRYHND